jgi:UDP-N-acetylglucosamine 2-epimerase (non-hydrolysing)
MKRIACIVGARPNFMKMAPILRAFEQYEDVEPVLIHTGQHYDAMLSGVFFEELGIRAPDISLEVGSGSHAAQTARLLVRLEETFLDEKRGGPASWSYVVVVGDVNSTMAAALAAAKLHIPVAHVEAGLRSFDRMMPEEINRLVTDSISDLLLVSEPAGVANLTNEGHPESRVRLVGNVMIDTLLRQVERARSGDLLAELSLQPRQYCVVTLHRPSNVDNATTLDGLMTVLLDVSKEMTVVFPVHPRTRARLESFGLLEIIERAENLRLLEPLGYNDFLCLTSQARVIVTDSGGLQEESTALGVPCLTMRENTERPITVDEGTSTLCGADAGKLELHLREILLGKYKQGRCPELWDGKAAVRIAKEIAAAC